MPASRWRCLRKPQTVLLNPMGLKISPELSSFHEKESRRHAHVVWSRIDAETMTAKNLPHFKNKLQNLSRDLFFEHQWTMPPGLRDRSLKVTDQCDSWGMASSEATRQKCHRPEETDPAMLGSEHRQNKL